MATIDEFLISLEAEFGEQGKGKRFEVFCKWFLENDPEWSRIADKVWLWDDYPDKWQRKDLGTDLVFRDYDGHIWAVQAKCFASHRSTTKADLNSFLADTSRETVSKRLWLQTTDKMKTNATATLKGQEKPVVVFGLNEFRQSPIEYPRNYAQLYQAKIKTKPTPDQHQKEAIEAVSSKFQSLNRGQMIMACGTGKTFTTLWIKEALKAQSTLVLLPSLSLLSQTMREWAWAGNTDFQIFNICSDQSVGKKSEDMDPSSAPFPVTSDVQEIVEFLRRPSPKVVFCTYQSSPLIEEAQRDAAVSAFDLTIADEAHRCAGNAGAAFSTILDGEKIRSLKRLFTTATPRYFGNAIKDEAKARDLEVIGMDNEDVFGPVMHQLTFGEAIQRDLLNDYRVVIVGVDEPMVKQWIDSQEIVALSPDALTDARTLAAKIGLIKAIKDFDLKRIISFHSRVSGARQFSEELVKVVDLVEPSNRPEGRFLSDYVSGEMKAGDRKDKIDRLKVLEGFERGILTNARCLAEGVDVPTLDGVAFIDPKGSQVEIIQAIGRAIRKVRGAAVQTKGTIVIPVFIEEGDDVEASINASNFKPVWDVLKALRAHDEVLADTLDQYRTNMAKDVTTKQQEISDKIIFDLPMSIDPNFSSALRTVLVEAATASWEFWYGLLQVFYAREGHCRVPAGHKESDFRLGNWVSYQRIKRKNLSLVRKKKLAELDFIWDALKARWEEGYGYLRKFYDRERDTRVPIRHKETIYNLGRWVAKNRQNINNLLPEQRRLLDALGFVWDPFTDLWEEGFRYLKQFHDREGHCRVFAKQIDNEFPLGSWVVRQRKTRESLTQDRRQRLEALGFMWDPVTELWDEGYRHLKQFYDREGHCRVYARRQESNFRLGSWVSLQRMNKNKLSSLNLQKLEDLSFVWDPMTDQWEQGLRYLKEFQAREGHCSVPDIWLENKFSLGKWVGKQRAKKSDLSEDRLQRLEDLGFVWDPRTEQWEQGFHYLKKFQTREGHCRVYTGKLECDFNLGGWVTTQRSNKERLSRDRCQRLDALGFIWDPFIDQWEEGFRYLQKFLAREGHCRVAWNFVEGEFKLGKWVGRQRKRKAELSHDRRQRLNALEFVWNATPTKK